MARRQYCGAVELIDEQIGHILHAVERAGLGQMTYVVYSSDHGEMLGDHGMFTKHCAYEASLRVPLVVAGPDIPGGRVSQALVELMDVNPTLCDFAGVPTLEDTDARSFAAVLRGSATEHRAETVAAELNYRAIRTPAHKLIENYNDATELYDLVEDPDEVRNLADQRRELAGELARRMRARFLEGEALR